MQNGINGQWVIKQYDGEQAKSVKQHINAGVGYFEVDSGAGYVVAAFRAVGEMPEGAQVLKDPKQISSLDRKLATRTGHTQRSSKSHDMSKINDIFFKGENAARKDFA